MTDEVRLIDANKLKETLKDLCSGSNRVTVRRIEDCMLHDIFPRIIDDEPTIEAEPVNGWISVDDRLPENETEVLIYCPEFVCTIKLAMWIEDGFYVDKEDLIFKAEPNGYCTHWMPLPEPPKEDKDG